MSASLPPPGMIDIPPDGRSVRVPAGTSVFDAARMNGINIPTLCHLQNQTPVGVCRLCVVDARAGEDARAGVHDAEAADADGSLGLQMAKRGDVDAVQARGIEDAGAGGYADGTAVESDVDHSGRCQGSAHEKLLVISS